MLAHLNVCTCPARALVVQLSEQAGRSAQALHLGHGKSAGLEGPPDVIPSELLFDPRLQPLSWIVGPFAVDKVGAAQRASLSGWVGSD
jgi:hypothetical protein